MLYKGSNAMVTVTRVGENRTTVSVSYYIAGSTAVSGRLENDDCATAGDFDADIGGYLVFAAGVTAVDIYIPIFRDSIWEEALILNERFAVVLDASSNAQIDNSRSFSMNQLSERLTDGPIDCVHRSLCGSLKGGNSRKFFTGT